MIQAAINDVKCLLRLRGCKDVHRLLYDYVEGQLDLSTNQRLTEHLGDCPLCQEYVESYRQTVQLTRACCRHKIEIPAELEGKLKEFNGNLLRAAIDFGRLDHPEVCSAIEWAARAITGESFFITTFLNTAGAKQRVAFAAPYPGKIIPLALDDFGGTIICQKDSFLCAAQGIEIEIAFTKRLGAGIFGGEGFILQRLKGSGMTFVHAGGTVIEKDLAAGESLRVDTGCLVAFSNSVDYDIKFVGGFTNALFGGEGLFLASLTGPGKVYLQSLPFSRLADRVLAAARFQQRKGESKGAAGIGGDILGNLLSGN